MTPPVALANKPTYRNDLDALRGVSVLLVVAYHAFPDAVPGGFIGVDIFFVISGFLITKIISEDIQAQKFSLMKFYARRIRRLLPPLLLVLATTLIAGWLVLFPDEYRLLGTHLFKSAIFLQNFQLIEEQGYFDVESHYKPLLHLWSLSVEEQYYLAWPLVLLTCYTRFNPIIVIFIVTLTSFVLNLYLINETTDVSFYHSAGRVWELALGSLLAIYLVDRKTPFQNKNISYAFFVAGVASIILSLFVIDGSSPYPGWLGVLPVLGAVFVIIARVKLNHWGGLVTIGLFSYPLYLWHWALFSFCYIYLAGKPDVSTLLFATTVSFALSFWTYKYIEQIRYLACNLVVPLLLIGLMIVGIAGFFISARDGLPERNHLAYLKEKNVQFIRTPATDEQCKSHVKSTLNAEGDFYYCRSEFDQGDDIIAMIGDSHAHALFPGVASVAAENGYSSVLYANTSCPPLEGFHWGRNEKERTECQRYINQITRLLQEDTRVKKVLIATRGPVYIHGEVKGDFTEESVLNSLREQTYPKTLNYDSYFKGYRSLLRSLSASKHIQEVYYFLENPELDFIPKDLILRPFDYWGASIKKSAVDRKLYKLRMKEYQVRAYAVTADFPKANVLAVEPYLCEGDQCFVYVNGKFLYADNDHFSMFGSEYILEKSEHLIFDKGAL
jgi:peptidoglycan/LPS O-acetylase OafA/YrhL